MRLTGILLLVLALAEVPAWASKPVTVAKLEESIQSLHGKSDADAAWALSDLEPTERISSSKLAQTQEEVPGEKSREALRALADVSAFLDPPATEIPNRAAPDVAEQRRIMGLVVAYVGKTIPQLPNFFATETTLHFEETPQVQFTGRPFIPYEPMHLAGKSQTTVLYREGREANEGKAAHASAEAFSNGLTTWGVFGPILGIVLVDAARSNLQWSHWERSESNPNEPLAVFKFNVPQDHSQYEINYCCVAHQSATDVATMEPYRRTVGYQGRMTIDPATGTIVRLVIEANLKAAEPVTKAAILVQYDTVTIGGRPYVCPTRSISATIAESVQLDPVYRYPLANQIQPLKAAMNEATFENYHVFRSTARVITEEAANRSQAQGPEANSKEASSEIGTPTKQTEPSLPGSTTAAASAAASAETAVKDAPPASDAAPVASLASESSIPEVSVGNFAPGDQSNPFVQPESAYTLRTTSRLVDVGVVVLDRKGHPVADLTRDDFEIDDNGVKQQIKSFTPQAKPGAGAPQAASRLQSNSNEAQGMFSNSGSEAANFRSGANVGTGNTTILMIDAANLAFGDLNYAREEMLRFLKTVAPSEPVGLYVMKSHGYEVLLEPTTDAALVAATLKKWMPDARDLGQAQDEERRTRRDIEYVDDLNDLFAVNGNSPMGKSAEAQPTDPQLRAMGSDPARDAFQMLPGIARKLAAIEGHKSLVWVSSDNALADWSDKASSVDRGNTQLDPLVLKAVEALNNAHVSIYPLDASQLEAGGVTASLPNGNVQLNPETSPAKIAAELMSLPPSERQEATELLAKSQRDINPGRITDQMKQDMHPIQGPVRELAAATGGRALRRAGDIAAELEGVVADGDAVYLLSFSPSGQPDDAYHHLTVKVANHAGLTLRYRSGYLYRKEPATLKERFREAVWKPTDVNEIGLTARLEPDAKGSLLKINIAAKDLDLAQQGERWEDRVDIFVVERDEDDLHARVTGKTLALRLKPATYEEVQRDGLNFEERVEAREGDGSLRIVVVDEDSGRMGSVTVPGTAMPKGK